MNARRRPLVALYALGSAIVLAALAAVTVLVVRQQAAHSRAVAEALHQEDVRTALWRMETRVSSLLALTTGRSALLDPQPGAYASNTLRGFDNAIQATEPPPEPLQERLVAAADQAFAVACSVNTEDPDFSPPVTQVPNWTNPEQQNIANRGLQRSVDEYARREGANLQSQVALGQRPGEQEHLVGPLASIWDRTGDELTLQFARRVQSAYGASHESYRIEWNELSSLLLAEITDLFPTAKLEPIEGESAADASQRAMRLAAVPARLVVPPPKPAEALPRGYAWTIAGAWAALVFALAVGGLALRSSYAFGEKHRRFTHAVTHELRTPLTTFRMYSEMLARGMVPQGSQAQYLETLESESTRLARLVDNVLRYARLEDGRRGPPRAPIRASELVERCVPELARACASHGATLDVEELEGDDARLETDAEAVLQILANLVENACKYGRPTSGGATRVSLRASVQRERLVIDVGDEGPGVPERVARSIFEPFDRGGRDSSDRAPGVGLGLALSRALARELGGSLELAQAEVGAIFRLVLPLSRAN